MFENIEQELDEQQKLAQKLRKGEIILSKEDELKRRGKLKKLRKERKEMMKNWKEIKRNEEKELCEELSKKIKKEKDSKTELVLIIDLFSECSFPLLMSNIDEGIHFLETIPETPKNVYIHFVGLFVRQFKFLYLKGNRPSTRFRHFRVIVALHLKEY